MKRKRVRKLLGFSLIVCMAAGFPGPAAAAIADSGITVEIPLTEGASNTAAGAPAGTVLETTGDLPSCPEDEIYDYTQTLVSEQGSVTAATDEITVTENVSGENSNLTYAESEAVPTASNDLIKENASAADLENNPPDEADGYSYVYAGSGNTSQLRPALVYTKPLTDAEKLALFGDDPKTGAYITGSFYTGTFVSWLDKDRQSTLAKTPDGSYVTDEEGYLLDVNGNRVMKQEKTVTGPDGQTYYLHRFDALGKTLNVEGWYQDGRWQKELGSDKYGVIYATSQQFLLLDTATGETVTVYCADLSTVTQKDFGYTMENLEDADYYTDEQAEKIRTIAANGYWGTENGSGSLDAMKERLRSALNPNGSRIFTDEEISCLTDGAALTATQMAIWSCSNALEGAEFVNCHYIGAPENLETDKSGAAALGDIPSDKVDEVKFLFKLYDYLKSMTPMPVSGTTSDTIINAENFLKTLSLTVREKAETPDTYLADLTFALVVMPSTENGDDLLIKIFTADGSLAAEGRIAGSQKSGEQMLTADADGNYTFPGITLIEGSQNFRLTLEGVQNLTEGVYLYTSEIRTGSGGDSVSSQTMVGMASGLRDVSVEMNLRFELDVKDQVVTQIRCTSSSDSGIYYPAGPVKPPASPPETPIDPPSEPQPESPAVNPAGPASSNPSDVSGRQFDDTSLSDIPKTGDTAGLWILLLIASGAGLACFAGRNPMLSNHRRYKAS